MLSLDMVLMLLLVAHQLHLQLVVEQVNGFMVTAALTSMIRMVTNSTVVVAVDQDSHQTHKRT